MGAALNYQGISRRPPDIEDYIDMLRRYRSWIVAPMFAGLVIGVVVAFLSPDIFVSYAVMQILPQQVPEKLVPSMVASHMEERLTQMKTEILSRGILSDIIQKPSLNLYPKERAKLPMEDVIQTMRTRDIQIVMSNSGSGDRRTASSFTISFRYNDKYKAAAVVRELVTRFTEQNFNLQKTQVTTTTMFMKDALKIAQDKMERLDQELTRFRMANPGRLPEQAQASASQIFPLQMQVNNLSQQISQRTQDVLVLETSLQNLKNEQAYTATNLEQTITSPSIAVKNEKLLNVNKMIQNLKSELAAARKLYGDKYPDIGTIQARIQVLEEEQSELEKQEVPQQPDSPSQRVVANPQMERQLQEYKLQQNTLQTQITAKRADIDELTRQKDVLEKQLAQLQKRIDEAPAVQQQYVSLQSEYALAKQNYDDMMKKTDTSETAKSLEDHEAGEKLNVLDPAFVPDKAVEPNRLAYAGLGTFGGLALGLVLAAAKEVKNTALKNLKDVRAYTNLPVLTSIPLLENALLVRRKRRLVWLAWSTGVIFGCMVMSGSIYYYMSGSMTG